MHNFGVDNSRQVQFSTAEKYMLTHLIFSLYSIPFNMWNLWLKLMVEKVGLSIKLLNLIF